MTTTQNTAGQALTITEDTGKAGRYFASYDDGELQVSGFVIRVWKKNDVTVFGPDGASWWTVGSMDRALGAINASCEHAKTYGKPVQPYIH